MLPDRYRIPLRWLKRQLGCGQEKWRRQLQQSQGAKHAKKQMSCYAKRRRGCGGCGRGRSRLQSAVKKPRLPGGWDTCRTQVVWVLCWTPSFPDLMLVNRSGPGERSFRAAARRQSQQPRIERSAAPQSACSESGPSLRRCVRRAGKEGA